MTPTGAVDAFGLDEGETCTLTWTATEDGTYLIIINEAGQCEGEPNVNTGNGFLAIVYKHIGLKWGVNLTQFGNFFSKH